jgi:hypothetical protein
MTPELARSSVSRKSTSRASLDASSLVNSLTDKLCTWLLASVTNSDAVSLEEFATVITFRAKTYCSFAEA